MTATAAARKPKTVPGDAPRLIILKSGPDREDKRVELFSIDGKPYSIPTSVRPNQALRYLNIGRTKGLEAQVDYMLGVLLGADGYEALMEFDDLTEEDLLAVVRACQKVMTGAVEAPKEK